MLRHGAGNSYGRVRARGRAGERFRWVRCMGAVSLHGCGFIFIQHALGNVFLAFRSRPRAAARRGERLGPVSCPGTCWGAVRCFRCMGAISLRGCGFVLARGGERFPRESWPPTCCSTARETVGAGFVPGDVLRRSFGSFVAWVRFYPFVPFHAAKGSRFSFLGVVPFSSTWRGTFSLRFVAAHVL